MEMKEGSNASVSMGFIEAQQQGTVGRTQIVASPAALLLTKNKWTWRLEAEALGVDADERALGGRGARCESDSYGRVARQSLSGHECQPPVTD